MEQTVRKALSLLEALVAANRPCRLTDLARQLGLTKPNTHRLLTTLCALGYAQKNQAPLGYTATLKVWELGSQVAAQSENPPSATPGDPVQSRPRRASPQALF